MERTSAPRGEGDKGVAGQRRHRKDPALVVSELMLCDSWTMHLPLVSLCGLAASPQAAHSATGIALQCPRAVRHTVWEPILGIKFVD